MNLNRQRLIDEFCSLVEIDSISFKEQEMAACLTRKLAAVDMETSIDEHGNLYGYLPGTIDADPLLFSAHMDTVEPGLGKKAVLHDDGRITSTGETVLGADDLSGIVAILESLRVIKEQHIPHRDIEILFPVAEELFLKGTEVYDFSAVKSKEAYVLDLSGPIGTAALKAPTVIAIDIALKGKASHAGFAPEKGIHAIAAAAAAISRIPQGRRDEETTVNIGTIDGGMAKNIVPEHCRMTAEIRSFSHERAIREAEYMQKIFAEAAAASGCELTFSTSFGCISYETPADHPVVSRFAKACRSLSLDTDFIRTFGGSDNNNFMRNGITGIVLACGMHQVHSCQEYTTIDDLVNTTRLTYELMTDKE